MKHHLATGRWGERLAAAYLEDKGVQIISKNVRTSYGEIDLVGRSGDEIIFFEVKTRTSDSFGMPEEAVTQSKLIHIIQSAQAFLQENLHLGENWRIDVIAIQKKRGQDTPVIEWFENVSS